MPDLIAKSKYHCNSLYSICFQANSRRTRLGRTSLAPAAAAAFTSEILPSIRSAPGLVAAYFVDPAEGRGLAFVVFDSEASARRSTPPTADWSGPGVKIEGTEYRRIAVHVGDNE